MKRFIAFLLCALLLCGCAPTAAPEETTAAPTTEAPLDLPALSDGKTLKVLAIGNSFSNNTTDYLYQIAAAHGATDITLGRLYIGGCSLQRHANNIETEGREYTYYKNTTGVWEKFEAVTMLYGLQDEAWDIITLQQSSGNSGIVNTYNAPLDTVVNFVQENKTNPDAKLVWHMTWAYQGDSDHKDFGNYANSQEVMYQSIVAAVDQKILNNDAFCAVIPAGTAVQNARTSYLGDTITRDGYHLNEYAKLIGGYIWFATFTGQTLDSINLDSIPGGSTLSEEEKAVILESVNNALKKPYEVTPSTITG